MLVADTELLFAPNPKDRKYDKALKILLMRELRVPDTALLEFRIILRARWRSSKEIASAMTALKYVFESYRIKEALTISIELFIKQAELQENMD